MKRPSGSELDPGAMLVFAALARAGGVRGAARTLGLPRSTLSRRLAELESQVGGALVVRTARRFSLTDLGLALAAQCDRLEAVLRDAELLARSAASEPTGVLRVAVAPVLGEEILPSVIAELVRRHPRLTIDARLSVDHVDLRRGAVDVALRASPVDDATDLFALRLGTTTSGLYASPSYLAARTTPRLPSDLDDHECIVVGERGGRWTFRSGSRDVVIDVSGRVRVDNVRVARDAAALGAGIARVARAFADPLVAAGDLVPVLERHWVSSPIYAVHAGPNPPSPRVRAFIDASRAAVAAALPEGAPPRRRWRSA
ncbi:MAG: LysR family transcriptional regulator [Deltaproteobacteria bacterium]|nr:LysR family transcriptional regulator [Deltaproteobacteria bacterium]